MELFTMLADHESQLLSGGSDGCDCVDGFYKEVGTDKCRGNATSALAGNLEKNGKLPCCVYPN